MKRSPISNGTYATIAANLTALAYTNVGLANGTTYYWVVSATNSFGESANSVEASARPMSTTSPQFNLVTSAGQIQLNWPMDHLGWRLETQTNSLYVGIGANWVTVPNSNLTNQFSLPINITNGSVFFRLTYP
jgi:cellulose 1,4-beta-cellobiosidase